MNAPIVWPEQPVAIESLVNYAAELFQQHHLFFGHGTDNAWDEAMWLVFHALDLPWSCEDEVLQQVLTPEQQHRAIALLQRRVIERKPAAYLTGKMFFAGLEFSVSEDVLVPRSPIAELINQEFKPWLTKEPARILDLCTGSACIGIACAEVFADAQVDCTDISEAALAIANSNILLHRQQDRVRAFLSDVFDGLALGNDKRYDLIVSNPPYVDAEDLADMPVEYHAEPAIGLAAGVDGLDICRRILKQAANFLNPNGCLVVEVGNSWQALEQAFPKVPFTWVEFEYGGDGVFVFSTEELVKYAPYFTA